MGALLGQLARPQDPRDRGGPLGAAASCWSLGIVGGALYGLIPAFLKTRFGVNEILTSLMLVYIAQLTLDYLARGPWRDPKGFNFPQSVTFDPSATLPTLFEGGRVHAGATFAADRGGG